LNRIGALRWRVDSRARDRATARSPGRPDLVLGGRLIGAAPEAPIREQIYGLTQSAAC
jgi:hypothetical protein